jgi:plastocyanin
MSPNHTLPRHPDDPGGSMRRLSVLMLLSAALIGCNKEITEPRPPLTVTVIASTTNQFLPPQTSVRLGGTVTWQFQAPHSVTFVAVTGVPADIQQTPAGASEVRTFPVAGTYRYDCTVTGHTEFGIITVVP